MKLNKFANVLAGTFLLTGVLTQAWADDTKTDPSGTYIWTMPGRNGGPDRTNTLVLKVDGDKLAGQLTSPGRGGQANSMEIINGKVTGADISFSVVRSFNDNTFTNTFSGTITDGTIKGKIEFERNGEARSRDWEAKKQDATK
ncbi:MAG TPA: hypothetical protein VKU37_05110 [Verrucomicrobiae bacterium]|nr:hypothetical protein [Verrucomicrobiae bacterium]